MKDRTTSPSKSVVREELKRKLSNGWIILHLNNYSYSKYLSSLEPLGNKYYILYKDNKLLSFYKTIGMDMNLYDSLIGLNLNIDGDIVDVEAVHVRMDLSAEGLENYIDEVMNDVEKEE